MIEKVDVTINFNYEDLLDAEGCVLHREHSPRLLGCVPWLVFPEMLQRMSRVKALDKTNVAMCPTGWVNVAVALQDLLENDGTFQSNNYSAPEKHYAWKAFDAFWNALEDKQAGEDGKV